MTVSENKYNEASYLYENKYYEKALAAYREYCDLIDNEEVDIDVYIKMAKCCENTNDSDEAIECYSKAIEINPNNPDIYFERGKINIKSEQYSKALNDFNKAIEINPQNADYYINRADSKRYLRKYQEALNDYDAAIKINPGIGEYYKKRSIIKNSLKMYNEAKKDYQRAIKLNPNLSDEYINYNPAEVMGGESLEAVNEYMEYNEMNNNNTADYYYNEGVNRIDKRVHLTYTPQTYKEEQINISKAKITNEFLVKANENFNSKKYKESLKYYEKCIKNINENDIKSDIYSNMGYCASKIGDDDLGFEYYSKCIELNPDNSTAYNNRALIYERKNEFDKAIGDYTKALEIEPDDITCLNNRARCYYEGLEDYEKALVDYKKYCELADEENIDSNTYFYMMCCAMGINDYDKAFEYSDKYIELNPDDSIVYNCRALIYERKNEFDKAIGDYTKALEIEPDDITCLNNRARCYYEGLEDYEKALVDYEKLTELDSENEEEYQEKINEIKEKLNHNEETEEQSDEFQNYYKNGISYYKNKDYENAAECYSRCLELNDSVGEAYLQRADSYYMLEMYDEANEDYKKYVSMVDPFYIQAILNMAKCEENLDNYEEAVKLYEEYLADVPENIDALEGCARLYSHMKYYEKSLEYCNRLTDIDEYNVDYHKMKADVLYVHKRKETQTINEFLFVIGNSNDKSVIADACEKVAECYALLNDYQSAIEAISRAISSSPKIRMYFQRAKYYENTGDVQSALSNYRRVLRDSSDRQEKADSENKINYLTNLKNMRINVENCTLVEIMSVEGINAETADKFFKLREEKTWYEIESFAKDLGLFNPKFLTSKDAKRLEFSLKPKADYGKRTIDF